MTRRQTAIFLSIVGAVLALEYFGVIHVYAQQIAPLRASVLVRYPGMSWAGGGRPVAINGVVVTRTSPECRLTPTEQKTLTCANLYAVNAMTDIGVDGVIVHLSGEGITSDIFRSINGGLVQMRVKQGKRYTITIDPLDAYLPLSDTLAVYGLPIKQGSKTLGTRTSELLMLQLWPK